MTDGRTVDRLVAHLRVHVADLRRLEQEGAEAPEVAERKRLILRLQDRLAYAVRDLLARQRPSAVGTEDRPEPVDRDLATDRAHDEAAEVARRLLPAAS